MDAQLTSDLEKTILDRLAAAGPKGLTMTGLRLPKAGTPKGRLARQLLNGLLNEGKIGNLGSSHRPCYVSRQYYRPLELAYEHIENRARTAGVRLSSKTGLFDKLRGAVLKKADEALKVLVGEGRLVRLKWAGKPLYVHPSALPEVRSRADGSDTAVAGAGTVDETAIRRAYRETVNEFGYPDVLINEVFRRLGGPLEPFKAALLAACRDGRAVPSVGDWSLSSPEERNAALYINGHPHLRIRFKE